MEKEKTAKMTRLSKRAFSAATFEKNSIEDASAFLKDDLVTRNVRSILEKFGKGRDIREIQKLLVTGLLANDSGRKKDSVERRVRGWLDPKSTHTLKKEDAIEAAFILQLDAEDADEFVALISEEKFHWRDGEEIVFIYGLGHKLSYPECREILNQPEIQEILLLVKDCKTLEEIEEEGYTEFVKRDVEKLETVEDLKQYLRENYQKLGHFHNMAYDMFMEMIGRLETPSRKEEELCLFEEEENPGNYTIRDILQDFFYKDIVLTARQKAVKTKKEAKLKEVSKEKQYTLNIIQKKIADGWPDEVSISRMKNRRVDVTRKALILLFLATDGDYEEDGYDYDLTAEEVFEDIYERLNDMLFFCGYCELDPRNPFDWVILYCIYVEDLFDIDPKIQQLLGEVFQEQE